MVSIRVRQKDLVGILRIRASLPAGSTRFGREAAREGGRGRASGGELNVSRAASKLNRNGGDNPASRAVYAYHRCTATCQRHYLIRSANSTADTPLSIRYRQYASRFFPFRRVQGRLSSPIDPLSLASSATLSLSSLFCSIDVTPCFPNYQFLKDAQKHADHRRRRRRMKKRGTTIFIIERGMVRGRGKKRAESNGADRILKNLIARMSDGCRSVPWINGVPGKCYLLTCSVKYVILLSRTRPFRSLLANIPSFKHLSRILKFLAALKVTGRLATINFPTVAYEIGIRN